VLLLLLLIVVVVVIIQYNIIIWDDIFKVWSKTDGYMESIRKFYKKM